MVSSCCLEEPGRHTASIIGVFYELRDIVVSEELGVANAASVLVESPLVLLGDVPRLASGPLQQQAVPTNSV